MDNIFEENEETGLLFSIIVPVYQVKEYLKESIESILNQNIEKYEVILIDDGSTDGSADICDSYSRNNKSIITIHQNNAGLSAARNTGIKASKGNYIVLLDSDDKLCGNALVKLEDYIYKNSFPDVIAHRRLAFNNYGTEQVYPYLYSTFIGEFQSNIEAFNKFQSMPVGNMGAWNFTVKKEYIYHNALFFYEGIYHEDEEWVPRILLADGKICFSDIVFYAYRLERDDSITKNLNIKKLFDKLFIIDHLQDKFSNTDFEVKESIRNRCCSLFFGVLCQMNEYKSEDEYNKFVSEVKRRIVLLEHSPKKVHRMTYSAARVLGIKSMANILFYISKKKREEK